ncbi:hypothetical protein HMPREF7215_0720 [Pyramidobacter piscolens W5455]|uniref:Uncharacterized protein n=1 Tax=Pyramidobacter piscolens W5455 TaxID=352165 RepID=A0ABP2HWW5_9BACT|nr:hypothetical protein HMPREF7215_0720 [Pyramidobacter piscolens W5455]
MRYSRGGAVKRQNEKRYRHDVKRGAKRQKLFRAAFLFKENLRLCRGFSLNKNSDHCFDGRYYKKKL